MTSAVHSRAVLLAVFASAWATACGQATPAGRPKVAAACDAATCAKEGRTCQAGQCVQCLDDAVCIERRGEGAMCIRGECRLLIECKTDSECGRDSMCSTHRCRPRPPQTIMPTSPLALRAHNEAAGGDTMQQPAAADSDLQLASGLPASALCGLDEDCGDGAWCDENLCREGARPSVAMELAPKDPVEAARVRAEITGESMETALETVKRASAETTSDVPTNTDASETEVSNDSPARTGKRSKAAKARRSPLCATLEAGDLKLFFDTASAKVTARATRRIRALARCKSSRSQVVVVQGHTDFRGSESNNTNLSTRRARKVAKLLRRAGIARVQVDAFGEQAPACRDNTPRCLALNRRVEVRLAP